MFDRRNYLILAAAFVAFVLSVSLWFTGQTNEGLFVASWVPSLLGIGAFVNLMMRRSRQ